MRKSPLQRKKPLRSRSTPQGTRRPKKRSASEKQRIYGTDERIEWITAMPCCYCGVSGFTVQAHVGKVGKGGSRKADASEIAPLCCSRLGVLGCHEKYDQWKAPFDLPQIRESIVHVAHKLDAEFRRSRSTEAA